MEEEISYNSTQDDEYVEIVKMDEQKPINDTECKHETLTPDFDDKIGTAVYYGCSNRKCGMGWYIQK